MAERKARVLDGKALAAKTRLQVAAELKSLREKYHADFQPGLTIVQVGATLLYKEHNSVITSASTSCVPYTASCVP